MGKFPEKSNPLAGNRSSLELPQGGKWWLWCGNQYDSHTKVNGCWLSLLWDLVDGYRYGVYCTAMWYKTILVGYHDGNSLILLQIQA